MSTGTATKNVLVIAGLGKASGTGASVARLFSKSGYSVALIARGVETVNSLSEEINSAGGDAAGFPVEGYTTKDISSVWKSILTKFPAPAYTIRAAVFNLGHGIRKPFLDTTLDDLRYALQIDVEAAFAFAREAILTFKQNDISDTTGARGTLIFTGATASVRGNTTTSAFSAGKHGLRALSQSLGKEFGKQNIHVSHVVVDGVILTERYVEQYPDNVENPDIRLHPDGIAKSYLYLVNQDRSAWTWELDIRPAHEKW